MTIGAVPDLGPAVRDARGLGASAPVELRTTHASWVFLAGDDVWKIKRPVDLGFLNFSALEDRLHYCQEEVRLNRRLAPDVYLGVAPVRRVARGLTLSDAEPDAPIVDWAVHMRRLRDEDSASARLSRGVLGAADLAMLAERLAAFHRAAAETPESGDPSILRRNVYENFRQTEAFISASAGSLLDRDTFEEVRSYQTAWLADHAALLAARVAEGRIREGHGDLRLEHVYLCRDEAGTTRPVVIDCLEFSPRFRCGDVASDAAFLAMELDAERRPDLAAGFLARLAEASDDFGLFRVIDFYLSYRAWVRGKVAAFVAADPSVPPEVRKQKRREARSRFALARSYAGRALDEPFVVAVGGVIGSGKSTLANALGRVLGAPVVASDRTRKSLAGLTPTQRGPASMYTDASRNAVYAEVLRRAGLVLSAGRGVILDATFGSRAWRADAEALARERGARFVFVEVACDDQAVLEARLAARRARPERAGASDATDAELPALLRSWEPPEADETFAYLRVDGSGNAIEARADAVDGLRQLGITPIDGRRLS